MFSRLRYKFIEYFVIRRCDKEVQGVYITHRGHIEEYIEPILTQWPFEVALPPASGYA